MEWKKDVKRIVVSNKNEMEKILQSMERLTDITWATGKDPTDKHLMAELDDKLPFILKESNIIQGYLVYDRDIMGSEHYHAGWVLSLSDSEQQWLYNYIVGKAYWEDRPEERQIKEGIKHIRVEKESQFRLVLKQIEKLTDYVWLSENKPTAEQTIRHLTNYLPMYLCENQSKGYLGWTQGHVAPPAGWINADEVLSMPESQQEWFFCYMMDDAYWEDKPLDEEPDLTIPKRGIIINCESDFDYVAEKIDALTTVAWKSGKKLGEFNPARYPYVLLSRTSGEYKGLTYCSQHNLVGEPEEFISGTRFSLLEKDEQMQVLKEVFGETYMAKSEKPYDAILVDTWSDCQQIIKTLADMTTLEWDNGKALMDDIPYTQDQWHGLGHYVALVRGVMLSDTVRATYPADDNSLSKWNYITVEDFLTLDKDEREKVLGEVFWEHILKGTDTKLAEMRRGGWRGICVSHPESEFPRLAELLENATNAIWSGGSRPAKQAPSTEKFWIEPLAGERHKFVWCEELELDWSLWRYISVESLFELELSQQIEVLRDIFGKDCIKTVEANPRTTKFDDIRGFHVNNKQELEPLLVILEKLSSAIWRGGEAPTEYSPYHTWVDCNQETWLIREPCTAPLFYSAREAEMLTAPVEAYIEASDFFDLDFDEKLYVIKSIFGVDAVTAHPTPDGHIVTTAKLTISEQLESVGAHRLLEEPQWLSAKKPVVEPVAESAVATPILALGIALIALGFLKRPLDK